MNLTAEQNASYDFALQQGMVRWSDLSQYQGEVLFPEAKGKDLLVGRCFACHGFQSRMASARRDEEGWRDRVAYMKESMHFFLGGVGSPFNDENAADVASYINSLFGEESVLPKSPAEMPKYKELVRSFDDDAMKIVYVEYELPGPSRMPWSAFPDKDGNYWMPYYGNANKIGRLDPKTGEVQEYPVPNQGTAAIHSAVPAADGSVWLTEQGSNKLGHWDPATRTITEFQDAYVPGKEGTVAGGSKHTLRIDAQGRVWATGRAAHRFRSEDEKFTQIKEIPSAYGLVLDKDGNCWFAEFVPNGKIGKVDAKTLKVTKWQPPTPDARPRRIQIDTDGTIWFAEFQAGKIGHFDPKTETFKEFALPGPGDDAVRAGDRQESHAVVFVRASGRDRESRPEERPRDRVSVPAGGEYHAGVLSRCAGTHVVWHAGQQQGGVLLSCGGDAARGGLKCLQEPSSSLTSVCGMSV